MRAIFDTDCDVYTGAEGNPPRTYKYTTDCRVVSEHIQPISGFPLSLRSVYVTMEGAQPQSPFGSLPNCRALMILRQADYLCIPSGAPPTYGILWVEHMLPPGGTPYWRCHCYPLSTVPCILSVT